MATIWGTNGKKLGEIRENNGNVYDANGQPAGRVSKLGTFDKSGRKLTDSQVPGLLLKRK